VFLFWNALKKRPPPGTYRDKSKFRASALLENHFFLALAFEIKNQANTSQTAPDIDLFSL
jgi:hypothetical protein